MACPSSWMLRGWHYQANTRRDLRIDWLRGLAMTCVIVNHTKLPSILSWFSYERFWIVTAAEVFVALSGLALGSVYGPKLVRDGWRTVARGLGRRAIVLYAAYVGVSLSIVAIAHAGLDVSSIVDPGDRLAGILDGQSPDAAIWRDIAFMRSGPWVFQIIGLYVCLVAAAVPCLIALRWAGWRPLLALSWVVYASYRVAPHALTAAGFESSFPILAWQLLFVHGIAIGYHRDRVAEFAGRRRGLALLFAAAAAVFSVLALCNPWSDGPSWLQWTLVSPERFTHLYFRYFSLADLGLGRLMNLAIALPVGYALLTWCWTLARPIGVVFVSLGRQSLGAFVLHVYGVLAIAQVPPVAADDLVRNTLVQVLLILAIAALLRTGWPIHLRRRTIAATPQALPA